MFVTGKVDAVKRLEKEIQRLQEELNQLKREETGFEKLDTDVYMQEVYNG